MEKRIISFSPPDISDLEIAEVAEALRSGWITTGPRTKMLECRLAAYIESGNTDVDCTTKEAIGRYSQRVVCLNSATAAEELNLRILGIKEGDEVIVPAYTYTASASAAIHCGATVKFVDIQKDGDPVTHMPEMDYDALERAITPKTKAIIPVELGGIVCDYDRIFEIVESKKNLFTPVESDGTPLGDLSSRIQKAIGRVAVVCDAAHALGASRVVGGEKKYVGAIADMTSFSFHAVKNFTTAEGGASTWQPLEGVENAEIYKMFQLLSLHGQNKDALAKTKIGAWEYDIIGPWYKCNMTDIMAAIGLRQLDRYKGLLERREQMMKKYDAVCAELGISHMIHHTENIDSSNHLYLIRVPGIGEAERNEIIEKMAERGVATNVHYKPLPMMTAYSDAYNQMPILFVALLFSAVASFVGGIYVACKQTKSIGITTMVAAAINFIVNISLVRTIGIYAGSISTLVSFLSLAIFRMVNIRKFVDIRYNYKRIAFMCTILILLSSLCFQRILALDIINVMIAIVTSFAFNREIVITFVCKISRR